MHLRAAATLALMLLLAFPGGAALVSARRQAPPPPPSARVSDRLAALHREAEALMSQERSLLVDLRRLEVERDLHAEESRQLNEQADKLTAEAQKNAERIGQYEETIEAARPVLTRRLVDVYKLGQPGYARLLLGAGDLRDLGRTTRLVTAMAEMDQRRVRAYTTLISRTTAARQSLDEQVARLETHQADAQQAANLAAKAVVARAELIRQIDARRDLNAQMAGELESASRRLQDAMTGGTGAPAAPGFAARSINPFRGLLDWPVATPGPARADIRGAAPASATVARGGVELPVADGQPVRSVHEGRVVYAGLFPALGQLIIIDHGGMAFSLYGYMGLIAVSKGMSVGAGQIIGASGRSPEGQPALYFELRIDGQPVDPLQWLKVR
jgi:septal ring factor EnvC (AmiA/AmiB activator)